MFYSSGSTLFVKVKQIFRQKNTIFFKNYNLTPHRYVQWTIPSLLYQTRRNNPLVYKGLRPFTLYFRELVDLELPKVEEKYETISIPIANPEPKVKFKEKRVTSLGSSKGGNVTFKKRKLGSGARNVRRRDDDD